MQIRENLTKLARIPCKGLVPMTEDQVELYCVRRQTNQLPGLLPGCFELLQLECAYSRPNGQCIHGTTALEEGLHRLPHQHPAVDHARSIKLARALIAREPRVLHR